MTVHLGQPNRMECGSAVPRVSFLGLQTGARVWHSGPETRFVMIMLTLRGILRLFPHTGEGTADRVVELGALLGDREARLLRESLSGEWQPLLLAMRLDRWLERRLVARGELERLIAAVEVLQRTGRVAEAAASAAVSRRQLHRWTRQQLGLGPKEVAHLARLEASVAAAQSPGGDPGQGFSDQAHQIRVWRQWLGTTPGAYRPSALCELARTAGATAPHYL